MYPMHPLHPVQGTAGSIEYLSPASAFGRVVTGLPQILKGGRFFDAQGYRVVSHQAAEDGLRYKSNGVRLPYDGISEEQY